MHLDSPLPVLAVATVAMLLALPMWPGPTQDPATAKQPSSLVPVARTDAWAMAREKEVLRRAREAEPAKIVFIGDSITQGWEDDGSETWEQHFRKLSALNLGVSGDRTEHVLHRLQEAPLTRLSPAHVVLLIGTNNLGHGSSNANETLQGVEKVITVLLDQCKGATVHVLEIFPRGDAINAMRGEVAQINQALRAFVRRYDENEKTPRSRLRLHAIGDLFVEPDGTIRSDVMPDGLHLSAAAYRTWAEALLPEVTK